MATKEGRDRGLPPRKRRPQPHPQQRFGDEQGGDEWEEAGQWDGEEGMGGDGIWDGGYGGGVTSSDTQEEVPAAATYDGAGAEEGRAISTERREAGAGAGVGMADRVARQDMIPRAVMLLVGNGFLLMYAFSIETIYAMFLKVLCLCAWCRSAVSLGKGE